MQYDSASTKSLVVSYLTIRRAIGALGLLLPILLVPVGWLFFDIEIQDNLSSYYHTKLRDVFVGFISAIGIFLFCYQGYDWIEAWTAYFAGISAIGIAFFPLDPGSDPLIQKAMIGYLHTLSGGVFFLTLAFYSLYHFPTSIRNEQDEESHLGQRNFVYRTSGLIIIASMLAMGVYLFMPNVEIKRTLDDYNFLLWMEWLAIWSFAAAWLTKGRAIFTDTAMALLALPSDLLNSRGD